MPPKSTKSQVTHTELSQVPEAFKEYIESANLSLLPHQVEGVNWCLSKESTGTKPNPTNPRIRGGLIADEMGLGKTIQILGTIICNPRTRTLIILPRALIEQWANIIKKTTRLSLYIYHGQKREIPHDQLKSYDIVITTYGLISTNSTARNNPKDPNNMAPSALHAISWSRVVFDEAHHIRNKETAAHNGAKKLSSKIHWLITGTPIQNSINDYHNLASILGLNPSFYTNPENMSFFIKHLLLKRTKAEVNLKLPNLKINEIEVPWKNINEKRLAQEIHSKLNFSNTICPSNPKMTNRLPSSALPLLTRSRQICVLPKMTTKYLKNLTPVTEEASKEETERFIDEATGHTSKLNAVIKKIMENKTNGKNKLLFCHYRDEIDYIKNILNKVRIQTHSLDGRTTENERKKILTPDEESKSICQILILQINTGCEGLNLQNYSEIYFITPHWNPAIEDQAIARAYRIGQKQETHVYRFKMAAFDEEKTTTTLDEHAINIQEKKREIMKILNKK